MSEDSGYAKWTNDAGMRIEIDQSPPWDEWEWGEDQPIAKAIAAERRSVGDLILREIGGTAFLTVGFNEENNNLELDFWCLDGDLEVSGDLTHEFLQLIDRNDPKLLDIILAWLEKMTKAALEEKAKMTSPE